MLVSSDLADPNTAIFSVRISNITRVDSLFEATGHISLILPPHVPSTQQVMRTREVVVSQLQQTQYILSTDELVRVGEYVFLCFRCVVNECFYFFSNILF